MYDGGPVEWCIRLNVAEMLVWGGLGATLAGQKAGVYFFLVGVLLGVLCIWRIEAAGGRWVWRKWEKGGRV